MKFDPNLIKNNESIIDNVSSISGYLDNTQASGTNISKEWSFYSNNNTRCNNRRSLPSITTSAKEKHRRCVTNNRSRKGRKILRGNLGKLNHTSAEKRKKISLNHDSHPVRKPSTSKSNEGHVNDSSLHATSQRYTTESDGSYYSVHDVYSGNNQMTADYFNNGGLDLPPTPPPPYSNPLNFERRPADNEAKPQEQNALFMYPSRSRGFPGRLVKNSWQTAAKKTNKVLLPAVRRPTGRCCSPYVSIIKSIQNNRTLLFLVHCCLFLILAAYIVIGACVLKDIDNENIYAVRGQTERERVNGIRKVAAEKLLNISLKAVLEKSRDAVLDTIFTSDTLQAALSVFKTSRIAFLPADRDLEMLSQNVLDSWERRIEKLLVKYHFICTMENSGFQLTPAQLNEVWAKNDVIRKPINFEWTFLDASVQSFCVITTMGLSFKSPSHHGRATVLIYAIFGAPLYWWIIWIWSKRLFNALLTIANASNNSNRKKIGIDEGRVPLPHHKSSSSYSKSSDTPAFFIFLSTILTVAYVIGLGPLGCGSPTNSFGERLESAFLALLLIRPPNPLPSGVQSGVGFIIYVIIGHIIVITFVRTLKKFASNIIDDIFSTKSRS